MTDQHSGGGSTRRDRARGAPAGSTRRELVRGAVAAGAVAAAAGALPGLLAPSAALAAPIGDAGVLDFLIRAEQTVVYAYERALAGGALSAVAAAVLRRCLSQEREHVDALSINLSRLGTSLPAGPTDLASFELALRSLQVKRNPATLHGEREWINFLIMVEAAAASAYHFAIEQLADDKLLQTASEIMANEAQHATVLSELLSPGNVKRAVPSAFVAGRG